MNIKLNAKKVEKIINQQIEAIFEDDDCLCDAVRAVVNEYIRSKEFKDSIKQQLKNVKVKIKPSVESYNVRIERE